MEVEKRSSKGGFLQLFDWNLKSRKKLVSNKSEQSEIVRHGKENVDDLAISRLQQVHENGRGPDARGDDLHYHAASSVREDDGYGTKVPGVVARLMGLDSMPSSDDSEPHNNLSFDSQYFRDSYYMRSALDSRNEHHIVIYERIRNKLDGMAKNPLELRLQKIQSRPIERYHTEVLPPKSAKLVSITHNRLLSPIKSPGFIPPKNAAYIMEASARIIDQGPRSTANGKSSSLCSSAPLRIQDLREKLEAVQKTPRIYEVSDKEYATKHVRRQLHGKGDVHLVKASGASKVGTRGVKTNDQSVSHAAQTKSNIYRRDGRTSLSRIVVNQEHSKTKPSYRNKGQPNSKKSTEKRTLSSRSSDVLRQNNQKQNCMTNKNLEVLEPSTSIQKDRQVSIAGNATNSNKVVNKIVVKTTFRAVKTKSLVSDCMDSSASRMKKVSGKKRPVNAGIHSDISATSNVRLIKGENSVKCNIAVEGSSNWDAFDRKTGLDVVSFTFTSPIKRSIPGSSSSAQAAEKNNSFSLNTGKNDSKSQFSTASSSGYNNVGSDALSVLLEQKLKELTSRVEVSHQDQVGGLSSSSFEDSGSTLSWMAISAVHTKGLQQHDLPHEISELKDDLSHSCADEENLNAKWNWQSSEGSEDHSNCSNNVFGSNPEFRYSSSVLSVEPSVSEASCSSLDSNRSSCTEDSKWCASVETEEVSRGSSTYISHLMDIDLDLADSACSTSAGSMRGNGSATTLILTTFKRFLHWELEHVKSIISNPDLMFEEFALGQVHRVMDPNLFDELESHIMELNKNLDEPSKVARRALFDCVEECLQQRCRRNFCGSFKVWAKWMVVFQTTDHLAEDLYREIFSWTNMVDLMVDELVDKDMSSQCGKWVDFETETFEEGIEVGNDILTSLIDELLDDIFCSGNI